MYSVKDFGAAGDGIINDTNAIQKAIDACASKGGGKVVMEPGVYLAATVQRHEHRDHRRQRHRLQKLHQSETGQRRTFK